MEELKSEAVGMCANCGQIAQQKCKNCGLVFYCRRECQKEHWRAGHKDQCLPVQIKESKELGRYLVATRNFSKGEVIFREEPLVCGPKQVTSPVCLGCYKPVNGSYRCSKCEWPMCGPQCEKAPDHQPECVVGQAIGSPIIIDNFDKPHYLYEVITPLRCLALKKKSSKKYEKLMSLESHSAERKGSEAYRSNQEKVVNMLRQYFMLQQFSGSEIDSTEVTIHEVTGIIDVNSIEINLPHGDIVAIYPTYAMVEHSCIPNLLVSFTDNRQIVVKAALDIKEGEHLRNTYTQVLWGTLARREHLKKQKYFMCTCPRCADPKELGTYFSSIKCPDCPKNGYLFSAAPLDELADWICESCSYTMSSKEVNAFTLKIGEEVEMVLTKANIKVLEDFIQLTSEAKVHPNHFHLAACKHTLLQMYGRDGAAFNEETIRKKEKLCREFLKLCMTLDPGMCRLALYAGVVLYEYHVAVMGRSRQNEAPADAATIRKDISTAKALLNQCIKILQNEPECPLRDLASKNLEELESLESSGI